MPVPYSIMIKFMRYYWLYFVISAIILIPGIYSLINWGLKPGIDFTGGTLLELEIKQSDFKKETFEELVNGLGIEIASIAETDENSYLLKTNNISQTTNSEFQARIATSSAIQLGQNLEASDEASLSATVIEKRFETLGPSFGHQSLTKAITAIGVVAIIILLFVSMQFKDKKYGVCAILAMFHDSLILLSVFSLLGHYYNIEVDTLFMTAVLTILSFSVHDTIVIYDRIRESKRQFPQSSQEQIIDKSINETLTRSVNNSMTIIFMLLALFLLGGESTRNFVLALLVGTLSGTYSSTFISTPLLIVWDKVFKGKAL